METVKEEVEPGTRTDIDKRKRTPSEEATRASEGEEKRRRAPHLVRLRLARREQRPKLVPVLETKRPKGRPRIRFVGGFYKTRVEKTEPMGQAP